MRRHRIGLVGALLVLLLTGACGDEGAGEPLVVYTSVTQETVDAVVAGFRTGRPDVEVDVFRAPTGELNARIAAEQREGGVRADVLWLTDPLSMQQYAADGMLRSWEPEGASSVPAEYRTGEFWGTRLLTLVIVARTGLEDPPRTWDDLIEAAAEGGVALPDPGFAGSAFAALGYFALADGYGMDFYRRLHDAGAKQVSAPGDVVTGVAEGQYAAGITLWFTANAAVEKGSPIEIVWPESGAIALYSPIGVTSDAGAPAEDLVEYLLSTDGQTVIAGTGWQPVRSDVPWAVGGAQVAVDWTSAFDHQEELLDEYRAIFGG